MSLIAAFRKVTSVRGVYFGVTRLQSNTKSNYLEYDKNPEPLFTDPETQRLLKSMTQLHINKVFRKKTVSDNSIEYKFMTTEQLESEFKNAIKRSQRLLQMPPIVQVKEDKQEILSKDPALKDFHDTKYVITDITYGLRSSDRKVIERDTDGTLQYASLETAKRMKQLYFPQNGRKIRTPRMFDEENLKRCMDEHSYEFILDCLTVQYEPDESEFHRISSLVYQHLNESKQFDMLRSTRHFGPMAFFYAWHRCIDDLLYDMIRRDYMRNGVELIALMYKIHNIPVECKELLERLDKLFATRDPAIEEMRKIIKNKDDIHEEITNAIGKTPEDFEADDMCIQFIEKYITEHSLKKVQLELAVQTLKEITAEKKQLFEGLNKAHGLQQQQQ